MEFEISTTGWWRPTMCDGPTCRKGVSPSTIATQNKSPHFILFQLDRSINRQSITSTSWDFSLKHKSWVKWFHFFPSLCSEIEAALHSDRESVEVKMELKLLMIKNINCHSIIITVSQMHVSLSLWSSLPYISIPYLRRLSIHSCCKFIMSIVAHHHHHQLDIEDIPDICHLFYTLHDLSDFKILHSKVHKTTKNCPK